MDGRSCCAASQVLRLLLRVSTTTTTTTETNNHHLRAAADALQLTQFPRTHAHDTRDFLFACARSVLPTRLRARSVGSVRAERESVFLCCCGGGARACVNPTQLGHTRSHTCAGVWGCREACAQRRMGSEKSISPCATTERTKVCTSRKYQSISRTRKMHRIRNEGVR